MIDKDSNWFTTILNGITGALGKFIGIFKKQGFVFSLCAMFALICFYTLIINPIRIDKIVEKRFESMYETEKAKEAESLQRRIQADEIVGDIIARLIDKFSNIHRIILLEGHNSVKSHTGVDFNFYSCTMEALTPNSRHFSYLSEDLQRQMRTNLIGLNMLNTLKHRDFLMYDSIKGCHHPDHRLIHKLADAGDNEALLIPFLNEAGEPIVLLVISGDELPVKDIVDYVNEYKKQIEKCLL